MYARVLRKWSLKTKLMSYLWLAVVTMLLLTICAPTTTYTMATTITSTTTPQQLIATTAAVAVAAAAATTTNFTSGSGRTSQNAELSLAFTNAGDVAESIYIPVDVDNNSNIQQLQQQNIADDSISVSRSKSSSNSKIFSSSRLFSNSYQHHVADTSKHADSIAYKYSSSNSNIETHAPKQLATVFTNLYSPTATQQQQQQQLHHALAPNRDYKDEDDDDDDDDDDESNIFQQQHTTSAADDDVVDNADDDVDADDVADDSVESEEILNNKQTITKVPNSQIFNLFNKFTNNQQQQQQQDENYLSNQAVNVHSTKARRHVQETAAAIPQQQQQQTANFHSPVRETVTMNNAKLTATPTAAINIVDKSSKLNSTIQLPAFRYIIESFEIPASLPLTEFTEQQRRMLLHQQQMRRLRMLEQQAARNRRDSRAFGLHIGGSSSSSSSYQQQHYYNQHQQQQQQQQQQYQRLQQQQQHVVPSNIHQKQHHHNNNNHHNHHHQQHQHHQRKRRRYCSARDPAQLAFEAPTVFEGKIISMTPDRRANFSATVEVKEIFKQQIGFRLNRYLRLQFAYRNTSGECDIYREQLRPRGLVRGDELEQGRIYLLFLQQIDLGNFTILGQPIRKTRRVIEAVKYAVSENYAQLASIRSITASNGTVENGEELRIVCKVQGRPPPKVTWFKDHKSINRNRKLYQIVPFKKRSELIIKSFNSSDAGRYECRAKNKVNRNLQRKTIVIKAYPVQRIENTSWTQQGSNCPPNAAGFCLNGGTCKLFVEIGSYSCICPEGFIGERCDRKEVNNMPPNPTYKTGYIADDPTVYDTALGDDWHMVQRPQSNISSLEDGEQNHDDDDDHSDEVEDEEQKHLAKIFKQ